MFCHLTGVAGHLPIGSNQGEVDMRLVLKTVGQFRRIRGRCPACNSEGPRVGSCGVCMGYEGPFPASEATQGRWASRFAHAVDAVEHPHSAPQASATLSSVR